MTGINENEKYVYVFVRNDLNVGQKVVQACHAVMKIPDIGNTPNVIVFGISKEKNLHRYSKEIAEKGIKVYRFCEPDMCNELTAFATEPVTPEQKEHFKRFCLL